MHGTPKYTRADKHIDYANPDAPKGDTLKLAAIGTFDTLNPFSIKGKAAKGLNLINDRLMARVWDEPFTMYPLIAERVDIPKDRSAITIHINPKARFHDGSPITADDVIYSFNTLRAEGRPNMRSVYKLVTKVKRLGNLSVHFKFGEGYDQETVMIIAMMPVLSKAYWSDRAANGKAFDSTTLTPPLNNGPYRVKSAEPGHRIILERVKDYWAKDLLTNVGHHNFNQIIYDYYRDDTVAFEAFKAGEYDLRREWNAGKWASAYDFPAIENKTITAEALKHSRPERTKGLIYNTRRSPFDDIKVRQALALMLDFEWLNKNLFFNQYKRITSYFPNSELAAPNTPSTEEHALLQEWKTTLSPEIFGNLPAQPSPNKRENLRAADKLLKEAGWEIINGKRTKNGKALTFEILLSAPEDEKIALHFKHALKRLGIIPSIRVMDSAAYRDRLNNYDFDMTLYYWRSSLSPGTEQTLYWGCAAAKEPSRWNFPGICTPAIDTLAKSIASSKSRTELVTRMHALDRLLIHGQYIIPLYYSGQDYIAYQSRIMHPAKIPLYGMVQETWWSKE